MELQYLMPDYSGQELAADYRQLTIPGIMVLLFGAADPLLSSIIILVIPGLNLLVDSRKLLECYRRPQPISTDDFAVWRLKALKGFAIFAAVTNWVLIDTWILPPKGCVNIYQGVLASLFVQFLIQTFIPDKAHRTRVLEKRHHWQVQRATHHKKDRIRQRGGVIDLSSQPPARRDSRAPPKFGARS